MVVLRSERLQQQLWCLRPQNQAQETGVVEKL